MYFVGDKGASGDAKSSTSLEPSPAKHGDVKDEASDVDEPQSLGAPESTLRPRLAKMPVPMTPDNGQSDGEFTHLVHSTCYILYVHLF